jgi:hypothetical protein
MTDTPNSIRDILETLSAEAFIFGNFALGKGVGTPLPDDDHELPPVEKAETALNAYILGEVMELLGDNLQINESKLHDYDPFYAEAMEEWEKQAVNDLKEKLRNKANKQFGVQE